MLGLWGAIVTATQMVAVERQEAATLVASLRPHWEVAALLAALVLAQTISYLCLPTALKLCTPAGLNLSLLTTIHYSLVTTALVSSYQYNISHLLPAAMVLLGCLAFHWTPVLSQEDLK